MNVVSMRIGGQTSGTQFNFILIIGRVMNSWPTSILSSENIVPNYLWFYFILSIHFRSDAYLD